MTVTQWKQCPSCHTDVKPYAITASSTWARRYYLCRCGQEWVVGFPLTKLEWENAL